MKEGQKTAAFVAVAAIVGLAAWLTSPRSGTDISGDIDSLVGTNLFTEFDDPAQAANLRLVTFDENLARLSDFELARDRQSGLWTIPSRDNYPADAAQQVSMAANSLIGLEILGVISERPDEHSLLGVVEPDVNQLAVGEEGVGTLVRMRDQEGRELASLIIGKADRTNPQLRFVRRPGSDVVFQVEMDVSPLTTDFRRWVEDDLLQLSSNDIDRLEIRDYDILQTESGGSLQKNFDAQLAFDAPANSWSAEQIKVYRGQQSEPRLLAADEQLSRQRLDELRRTLDSLRLVDVARKPRGLAADLKAEDALLQDRESIQSLFTRGFIPQPGPDGSTEILATSGELLVTLTSGVKYLLRFGNSLQASDGGGVEGDEGSELARNRYLLVTARVDESRFPMPQLKTLPETVEGLLRIEAGEAVPQPAPPAAEPDDRAGGDAETAPPTADPPAEDPPAEDPPAEDPPAEDPPAEDPAAPDLGVRRPADRIRDSFKRLVSHAAGQEGAPGELGLGQPPEGDSDQPATLAGDEETAEELQERLEAVRERINRENQRLLDEREERLGEARRRAAELNARFSDWYYIISDADYRRLRVSLEQLIEPLGTEPDPASQLRPPEFGLPPGFNF